jgi:hypothetical protein
VRQCSAAHAVVTQLAGVQQQVGHVMRGGIVDDRGIEREIAVGDQVAQPDRCAAMDFRQRRHLLGRQSLDRLADDLRREQDGIDSGFVAPP